MTEATLTREQIIRATVWGIPVIAAAVAAPAQAASSGPSPTICVGPKGTYEIDGRTLTIRYRDVPDIYEVNVEGKGWKRSYGTNYGLNVAREVRNGGKLWVLTLPDRPSWAQVHPFDQHYGEATCPARGGRRA